MSKAPLLLLLAVFLGASSAMEYNITTALTTSAWMNILTNLQGGDIATIYPGTYQYGVALKLSITTSSKDSPVIIRGAPGQTRPILQQTGGENIINLSGNGIILRDIEFIGGSLGVRLGETATVSDSIFYNLKIHGTQGTGFTANFPNKEYVNLTIEHNEIYDTGSETSECFYLGCVDDECRIRDSKIIDNYCHDTQSAVGGGQGAGVQVKTGSSNNIIQDNVGYNLGGPVVLIYDDYDRGRNKVIGNLLINGLDNGIQACAGADIINNILINARANGISIQNSGDLEGTKPFRNLNILHNTVINVTAPSTDSPTCGRFNGASSSTNWVIANNVFFCPSVTINIKVPSYQNSPLDDLTGVPVKTNVYIGGAIPDNVEAGGMVSLSDLFAELIDPSSSGLNFYPLGSGDLPAKGTGGSFSISYDFNGESRDANTPTIGAYEYSTAANPGGPTTPGFKTNTSDGGSVTTTSNNNGGGSSTGMTFKAFWLQQLNLKLPL